MSQWLDHDDRTLLEHMVMGGDSGRFQTAKALLEYRNAKVQAETAERLVASTDSLVNATKSLARFTKALVFATVVLVVVTAASLLRSAP